MHLYRLPHLQKKIKRPYLFTACLLLSLLLHLLILWRFPQYFPKSDPIKPEPTFVTLQDRPELTEPQPRQLELDETPPPDQEPPEKTSRYAEANQTVAREMAPTGKDSRDEKPVAPVEPQQALPATPANRSSTTIETAAPSIKSEDQLLSEKKPAAELTPSLQKLTQLTPDTLHRIAREERRERVKRREDVLAGDEIYLNLQHDYLISFFKRFSNKIEAVWNYPVQAAQRGEEGVLLLKITIDRKGELLDVELQESSGSDDLDFEAIQAIYRAAPFGPITSHWPHEQMKIYAHFQYTLTSRYIYGR